VSRGRTMVNPGVEQRQAGRWQQARPSSLPPDGKGAGSRAKGTAPKRSSSAPPRKPRFPPAAKLEIDWAHPDGIPLEDIDENAVLTGVVTCKAENGVYVDVGAERDALLSCPARFWKKFWPGDILDGLTPEGLNLERRRFKVHLPDPEAALAKNREPLSSFELGSYVDGVIEARNQYGIFVNIRAENTGRLNIPYSLRPQFFRGMVVKQVKIVDVDAENRRIGLALEDPEVACSERAVVSLNATDTTAKVKVKAGATAKAAEGRAKEAKPRLKAEAVAKEAKPKAKAEPAAKEAKVKAKVKAETVAQVETKAKAIDEVDIQAGCFVDGVVTDILAKGVLVDIGLDAMCTLVVSAELKKEFQKGDRVQGMMVEKVSPTGNITLSMEDPELELDEVPQPKAETQRKAKAKDVSRVRAA